MQQKITQVQCHAELLPFACNDDAVDMRLVSKYFTDDDWQAVEVVLKAKVYLFTVACVTIY